MSSNRIVLDSPGELSSCKGVKIVQLNCYLLINKIDEIRQVLMADSIIEVLCITETWFKPHHSSKLFDIHDYQLIRLDRTR